MPDLGLVNGNSQNDASAKRPHTRSTFDMSYHFYDTMRFGELHPHFVMEAVKSDKIRLRSSHDVRSYSLKAPLMSKIQLKKDYFAVPMEAILPFNWDKIYCNPPLGDDVPSDAGTYVSDFTLSFKNYLNSFLTTTFDTSKTASVRLDSFLHFLIISEGICSNGSLLASLGVHLNTFYKFSLTGSSTGFDDLDRSVSVLFQRLNSVIGTSGVFQVEVGGDLYVFNGTASNSISINDTHVMLEILRDNWDFKVTTVGTPATVLSSLLQSATTGSVYSDMGVLDFGLDLKRLFAYQIVCAHFYSNDHVDYIYSSELYRQYIGSLLDTIQGVSTQYRILQFTYNSLNIPYDFCSSKVFTYILSRVGAVSDGLITAYLQAIFGYKHSLRFVDYFVGARTRPLAVGDVNVDVQSGTPNYVNIVDVTQRTQMQRFLNAVNISGRKFSNYLNELFPGGKPAPDYHNPFYIGHTADDIYGQEIENTNVIDQESAQQGLSIISNLRSNGSRYEFNFECDRPCILLGISYFDVPRSYWSTIERQNFAQDRFDMFNPYMQFIGDQAITIKELLPGKDNGNNFGYTGRYMEYKQRYNQCAGGFVHNLPGYTFLSDREWDFKMYYQSPKIDPSFIRSKNYELDRFYISLTGFSLSDYFHFIVNTYNDVKASRPMAYNPQIL